MTEPNQRCVRMRNPIKDVIKPDGPNGPNPPWRGLVTEPNQRCVIMRNPIKDALKCGTQSKMR